MRVAKNTVVVVVTLFVLLVVIGFVTAIPIVTLVIAALVVGAAVYVREEIKVHKRNALRACRKRIALRDPPTQPVA
jgi:hypothetical protein